MDNDLAPTINGSITEVMDLWVILMQVILLMNRENTNSKREQKQNPIYK